MPVDASNSNPQNKNNPPPNYPSKAQRQANSGTVYTLCDSQAYELSLCLPTGTRNHHEITVGKV